MTAINAFQDEFFAYIGCDSAYVNYDGTIESFGFKMVYFAEFRMALAISGAGLLQPIIMAAKNDILLDQSSLFRSMENHFLAVRKQAARERPQYEAAGLNDMTMIAACFIEEEARPAIFRIATSDANLPGFPVNEWHEIDGYHIPGDFPADTLANPYVDDPFEDSRALFRAQRKCAYPGIDGVGMGGTCSLIRVGRHSLDLFDILEFNDQIGRPADIDDLGNEILRMKDMGV